MSIGENIKKHRKTNQLTQEELGKLAGLSTMSIRRYEKNERTPTFDALKHIATALNISISELIDNNFDQSHYKFMQYDLNNTSFINEIKVLLNKVNVDIKYSNESDSYYLIKNSRKIEIEEQDLFKLNKDIEEYIDFLLSKIFK